MRTPTIVEYCDNKTSVCSHWRGHGVLAELSRQGSINLIEGIWNKDNWDVLRLADIAFFQRPMSKKCFDQIATAKDHNLRIWIDLDDSNEVPPHHEVYPLWCEEYDERTFFKIMLLADVVTVSTKYLRDYYLTYSNNVIIVPNAINDHWLPFANKLSSQKIVLIRGGGHHLPDIWEYRKEIAEVMNNHLDWKLYVLGSFVHFFIGKISNYEFKGDLKIHDYFAFILRYTPSIFIVPLCDNELNHAKSKISWQEATLCGGVALLPSYWNLHNHGLLYDGKESFKNQFERLISDEDLRARLYNNSYDKVQKEYLLSKVNNQRLEIIKNLMR